MILTVQAQLHPDPVTAAVLSATLARCNAAATWLGTRAVAAGVSKRFEIHRRWYRDLRARFGLSAQMAVRVIAQVAGAMARDRSVAPVFRETAALAYDARMLTRKGADAVSLLTLEGRCLVSLVAGPDQAALLSEHPWGEADLIRRRDGRWFLNVSLDVQAAAPIDVGEGERAVLGVDAGVVNLATTSDGDVYTGAAVEAVRVRYTQRRRRLQRESTRQAQGRRRRKRRPKNVRRALRRAAAREARFRRAENHRISRAIVQRAQDTQRAIAVEELRYIRARTRFAKAQRARMSGWAFAQLQQYLAYKAERAGLPFHVVDAAYTSQTCHPCGHVDRANRREQATFVCTACGHAAHADVNAAQNIRARAAANRPMVSRTPQTIAA